jgi:hypothetical protein
MDSDVAVQEYKSTFGHLSIELCLRDNCFFFCLYRVTLKVVQIF